MVSKTFDLLFILIIYNNSFVFDYLGLSAAGNIIVKELLNDFPFPLTVTLAQLFSVWILSIPLLQYVYISLYIYFLY